MEENKMKQLSNMDISLEKSKNECINYPFKIKDLYNSLINKDNLLKALNDEEFVNLINKVKNKI